MRDYREFALEIAKNMYSEEDLAHALDVAKAFARHTDQYVVAVLHDILEDTTCTQGYIDTAFPEHIADAVNLLTWDKDLDTYTSYVERIRAACWEHETYAGLLARDVKLADMNVNLRRLHLMKSRREAELRNRWEKGTSMLTPAPV